MRPIFIALSFVLFSSSAWAHTLFLCSENTKEGRRLTQLENWLNAPMHPLSPNSCEQALSHMLNERYDAAELWSAIQQPGVYRKKPLIDRLSTKWFSARPDELEELAASFFHAPDKIWACTLKPLKEEKQRDFRMQVIYQAKCQLKLVKSSRSSCEADWISKAMVLDKEGSVDPMIQQIIHNGAAALAKCVQEK